MAIPTSFTARASLEAWFFLLFVCPVLERRRKGTKSGGNRGCSPPPVRCPDAWHGNCYPPYPIFVCSGNHDWERVRHVETNQRQQRCSPRGHLAILAGVVERHFRWYADRPGGAGHHWPHRPGGRCPRCRAVITDRQLADVRMGGDHLQCDRILLQLRRGGLGGDAHRRLP